MQHTKAFLPSGSYILVDVKQGCYRFSLVYNKNLKHRHGNLEYTNRKYGTELSIHIPNIEAYELIGLGSEIDKNQWKDIVEMSKSGLCRDYSSPLEIGDSFTVLYGIKDSIKSGLSWLRSIGKDPETTVVLKLKTE